MPTSPPLQTAWMWVGVVCMVNVRITTCGDVDNTAVAAVQGLGLGVINHTMHGKLPACLMRMAGLSRNMLLRGSLFVSVAVTVAVTVSLCVCVSLSLFLSLSLSMCVCVCPCMHTIP